MDNEQLVNDLVSKVLDAVSEMKSDVVELRTQMHVVLSEIASVKQFQKDQNGRVWKINEVVNTHLTEEKTNHKWQAAIWAVIGSGLTLLGKEVLTQLLS